MMYLMYTTSVANMTNHATTHMYASTRKALSVATYPMAPIVMAASDNIDLHAEAGRSQVQLISLHFTDGGLDIAVINRGRNKSIVLRRLWLIERITRMTKSRFRMAWGVGCTAPWS